MGATTTTPTVIISRELAEVLLWALRHERDALTHLLRRSGHDTKADAVAEVYSNYERELMKEMSR